MSRHDVKVIISILFIQYIDKIPIEPIATKQEPIISSTNDKFLINSI